MNTTNPTSYEAPIAMMGSRWRHKTKRSVYRITERKPMKGTVYLQAETKGARSTWKAECLLEWDYEPIAQI